MSVRLHDYIKSNKRINRGMSRGNDPIQNQCGRGGLPSTIVYFVINSSLDLFVYNEMKFLNIFKSLNDFK